MERFGAFWRLETRSISRSLSRRVTQEERGDRLGPELNRDLVDRLVGVAVLRLRGLKKGRATKS